MTTLKQLGFIQEPVHTLDKAHQLEQPMHGLKAALAAAHSTDTSPAWVMLGHSAPVACRNCCLLPCFQGVTCTAEMAFPALQQHKAVALQQLVRHTAV
jgi:hypothetical protein